MAEEFNQRYFFGELGFCPYCRLDLPVVLNYDLAKGSSYGKVWFCSQCGFWEYEQKLFSGGAIRHIAFSAIHYQGLVRTSNGASGDIPLRTLVHHVKQNPTKFQLARVGYQISVIFSPKPFKDQKGILLARFEQELEFDSLDQQHSRIRVIIPLLGGA